MGKKRVIQKSGQEPTRSVEDKIAKQAAQGGASGKIQDGRVYIFSSYNNTIMSLTDTRGNVISNVSAGAIGFRGSKKSTPFAASRVADTLAIAAKNKGIE